MAASANKSESPVDANTNAELKLDQSKTSVPNVTLEPVSAANANSLTATFDAQSDAPTCGTCGSMMVRNGACYKCLNCGSTSGCS